jgi:outer membrane lipoprotein carrier protein
LKKKDEDLKDLLLLKWKEEFTNWDGVNMKTIKHIKWLICAGILICSNTLWAQTAADDLAAKLSNIKTMQANFNQTLYESRGPAAKKTSGQMYLQRPGKFHWQINQPKQILIADGSNLWVYDVELQQATKQRLNNRRALSPAELLSGSVADLQRQFIISYQNGIFSLQPKSRNEMFQQVQLKFVNDQLRSLRFLNNLGQTSQLQFSDIRINAPLNPGLFHFTPPKGVDVVPQ